MPGFPSIKLLQQYNTKQRRDQKLKMPNLKRMMPGNNKGMGTTAKILMVTLPIIAFVAGRMLGNRGDNDS